MPPSDDIKDMNNMLDQSDDFAEAWIAEKEGDQISGIVVSRSSRDGGWGEYPIVVIQTESNDEFAVHCAGTVIRNKILERNPQAGDRIGIRYLGMQKAKNGNEYRSWKIVVQKTATPQAASDDNAPF